MKKIFIRASSVLIALAVIATGIRGFVKGSYSYNNWWGGLVFAPITVIVGLFVLYLVVFKWDSLMDTKRN